MWTFHAARLASGTYLGEVACASWYHEDLLNDDGAFTGVVAWTDPLYDQAALDATTPNRTVVYPVRNGRPVGYCGVIWRRDRPTFSGSALLSYFDRQPYLPTTPRTFAATDQHLMMKELVDWVQTNRGRAQIDTSQVVASGTTRDQTWSRWDAKLVGEALRQKADNLGGYDLDFRVEIDGAGQPVRRMRMWTPLRGSAFTSGASPVFTVGLNVDKVPEIPEDGLSLITEVVGLGVEINPTTKERQVAVSTRTDLLADDWPRLAIVLDRNDIGNAAAPSNLTSLQAHVDGYAALYGAVDASEIVLKVDPDHEAARWGDWDLGDHCMVVIKPGVDVNWPLGYSGVRRIVGTRWNVDGTGETLHVLTGRPLL